jgi:hypothetical protein
MVMWKIAVVNNGGVPQGDVEMFAAAADERLNSLLIPAWPIFAGGSIRAVPLGDAPEQDEVPVTLVNTVTDADALAFHTKTLWGFPTGTVELPQAIKYGVPWTVSCCHEIDEIFGNPELDQFVTVGGRRYPKELDDFVTSDQMPTSSGIWLSNAVTPVFFDPTAVMGTKFDLMGKVTHSLAAGGIPKGGWAQWQDSTGAYASAYGAEVTPEMRAYVDEKKGRAWRIGKLLAG